MSFTYNNKTKEYDVHGTATMHQFETVWNPKKPGTIHIFSDGVFNFSDKDRRYTLKKVIIEDKGKFHAAFMTIENPRGNTIVNEGNCEIGQGSSAKGIENSGIMLISSSRIEKVSNTKYLELKNKSIAWGVSNYAGSCLKTVGSLLLDSWADMKSKVWQGNSIYIGCDSSIAPKNKLEQKPYIDRNYVNLTNLLKNKPVRPDQELFTRVAYFVSNTSYHGGNPVNNADLADIESLINANPSVTISKVLAAQLLIYADFQTNAGNVIRTMSVGGRPFSYPK